MADGRCRNIIEAGFVGEFHVPAGRIVGLCFFPQNHRHSRLLGKEFPRYLADLLRGEGLVDFREETVGVRREAEEEIEGGVAGVGGGGLLLEGGSAEDGGADALEGVCGDAFGGNFIDFLEQLGAG